MLALPQMDTAPLPLTLPPPLPPAGRGHLLLSLTLSPCSSPPHMSQLTPPFTLQRQQLCVDEGGRREGGREGLREGRREIVGSDDFFEGN